VRTGALGAGTTVTDGAALVVGGAGTLEATEVDVSGPDGGAAAFDPVPPVEDEQAVRAASAAATAAATATIRRTVMTR
jgi:hypothetical protein